MGRKNTSIWIITHQRNNKHFIHMGASFLCSLKNWSWKVQAWKGAGSVCVGGCMCTTVLAVFMLLHLIKTRIKNVSNLGRITFTLLNSIFVKCSCSRCKSFQTITLSFSSIMWSGLSQLLHPSVTFTCYTSLYKYQYQPVLVSNCCSVWHVF